MRRISVSLVALVSVAACLAQADKVTFSASAGSAKSVLKSLSKATSLELEVSNELQWSVLVVSVKDMDQAALLKRIAEVTSGEWEKTNKGFRLILSREKDRLERAADLDARSEMIRRSIAQQVEALNKVANLNTNPCLQLLSSLDPKVLASIKEDSTAVFATPANRSQLPLKGDIDSIVAHYMQKRRDTGGGNTPGAEPQKVYLMVDRSFGNYLRANLKISDQWGNIMVQDYFGLSLTDLPSSAIVSLPNPLAGVVLSDESIKVMQALSHPSIGGSSFSMSKTSSLDGISGTLVDTSPSPFKGNPPSKEILAQLDNPVEVDPLCWGSGEAVFMLAKSQHLDIVGCLPDSLLLDAPNDLLYGLTAQTLAQTAQKNWNLSLRADGNVLMVRPNDGTQSRDLRLNRQAMKTAIDAMNKQGYLNLNQTMSYFASQPLEPDVIYVEYAFYRMAHPEFATEMRTMYPFLDRMALVLWAGLGEGGRNLLQTGAPLSLKGLPPSQKAIAGRIFSSAYGLNYSEDYRNRIKNRFSLKVVTSENANLERTEALPNGLIWDGWFSGQSKNKEIVFGVNSRGNRCAQDVVGYIGTAWTPDGPVVIGEPKRYPQYQVGSRTILSMQINFSSDASLMFYFADDRCDPKSRVYVFNELPASYQKWVIDLEKKVAQERTKFTSGTQEPPRT